jgi:hypothetical protein
MLNWIHRIIMRRGKKPTTGCCPECYGTTWRPARSCYGQLRVCKSCSYAVRVESPK